MVDIETLLPKARTAQDYLDLVADPRVDEAGLQPLARSPYSFVRLAVAKDPRANTATLAELLTSDLTGWNRNHLLALVAMHPRADRAVLLAALDMVAAALGGLEDRPYAAALALAERTELELREVRRLVTLPGSSRRMRRGLERNLARRTAFRQAHNAEV